VSLPRVPWLDPTLQHAEQVQQVAWFLYGCMEREHLLNVDACVTWWVRTFAPAAPWPPARRDAPG
jgi:hypothetical protein